VVENPETSKDSAQLDGNKACSAADAACSTPFVVLQRVQVNSSAAWMARSPANSGCCSCFTGSGWAGRSLYVTPLKPHATAQTRLFCGRFMEDDFELCANGLLALQYAVAKAHSYEKDWSSIRFGWGFLVSL
jgi:hypothetical protein